MAYIGKEPIVGNFQKCDALLASGTADYTLQVSSTNVSPESVNHMIVSLNGVIQSPTTAYTVSGSTLSFASSLTSSDTIDFVMLLGNVLDIGTPSDATVTNAKLGTDLISGETDIGGAIADADLFLIDDGAGGTLRKTAASRIKTYAGGANTPAFMAYLPTEQGVTSGTYTKVTNSTEVYDSDSCYDPSSNYRFTPTTAGKYFVFSSVMASVAGAGNLDWLVTSVYKNGTKIIWSAIDSRGNGTTNSTTYVSTIVDMNGSSDYLEQYARCTVNSGAAAFAGYNMDSAQSTYFGAYLILT